MADNHLPQRGFATLATANTGAHLADQMALAALPLMLTAANASAGVVSAVVAAQALAWLVVSSPAGALAGRVSRRSIMRSGGALILLGAALGWSAGVAPIWLALAGFCIASGVVLTALSVFALLPRLLANAANGGPAGSVIAAANARLEFGRACVALAAPVIAAYLITRGVGHAVFALAAAGGLATLVAATQLPFEAPVTTPRLGLGQSISDGARFVVREPILRAIAWCAIAWNSAFFAMTAVLAPYAVQIAGLNIEQVGQAWAVYGAGL